MRLAASDQNAQWHFRDGVQEYLSYTAVLAELILTHSEMFNEKRKEEVRDFLKICLL